MGKILAMVFVLLVLIAVLPWVCMSLWNWLVPDIFGLQTITYWQALGLMLLSSCFTYRGSSSSSK